MSIKTGGYSLSLRLVLTQIVLALLLSATPHGVFGQACGPGGATSLPVDPGKLVSTCCSGVDAPGPNAQLNPDGFVVALVDGTSLDPNCMAGSTGTRWYRPPLFHNDNSDPDDPNIWNARNLGQVFGLAIDDGENPNIYVSASTIYGEFFDNGSGASTTFGPGGPGAIYRLDGTTGEICMLASLPNSSEVGLGNIAYSPHGGVLYVSNMEDGLIYRIPINPCPQPAGTQFLTFDHGLDGRAAMGLQPIPDSAANRFTELGRRVWGVAVNEEERRLYYCVWWEHNKTGSGVINATEDNEVWSVSLDTAGNFLPNTTRREFAQPPFSGGPMTGYSNPASDISFSPTGKLLLAERTRAQDSGSRLKGGVNDAHAARALVFNGGHLNWTSSPTNQYRIGNFNGSTGANSAGGVVADCEDNVWASGDALHFPSPFVYGLQRIPAGGNIGISPPTRDSFIIDLDDDTSDPTTNKTELGDVTINNRCFDCTFEPFNILCDLDSMGVLTDDYVLTGLFTNLQDIPGTHLLLPQNAISPSGVDLCFGSAGNNVIVLDSPLNNGDSFELGRIGGVPSNENAIIIKNAQPGDEVCFRMTLLGDNGVECCTIEACVVMPPCDCLQIDTRFDEIVIVNCDPSTGLVDFEYTFQLTNLFGQDVYHSFLSPNGSESFSPDYFFVGPLPSGQSTTITTQITGATSEQLVNFLVTVHNEDLSECCSREHQVLAPECTTSLNAVPNGFITFRGNQVQGNLESVFASDDDRLCFNPGFTINTLEAPVWIVFDGTLDTTPASLNFDVESSATTPGLTTTLDAWNWHSEEFVQIDSYSVNFNNDTTHTMAIAGDVSNFVDASGAVKSRVGTRQTGFVINYPWEVRFDCVSWSN